MQWYFDFISPFAYLQSTQLTELAKHEDIECVPVLFAGLLNHWGNVGPAEVAPKRTWTFEHCIWLAERDGIPFKLPPHHPFNPLPLLRLSLVMNSQIPVVQRLFKFVWVDGHVPQDDVAFNTLLDEFGVSTDQLQTEKTKQQLRINGEQAVNAGVFGVPTLVRGDRLFWGYDATDMAVAHREGTLWPEQKIAKASTLSQGTARKQINQIKQ